MSKLSPAQWIGKTETCNDVINKAHVDKIAATLGTLRPAAGEPLPMLWHWAFFQEPVSAEGLGEDGHPARGGFLPPADNRNRMWAGGHLDFLQPLRIGVEANRTTTIGAVEEKQGRSGSLLFVTVNHEYTQAGKLCVREQQNIVYREPAAPKESSDFVVPEPAWCERFDPTPVTLFRYSAVTFNGHRIHYDHPYATGVEGYSGLVVHGPLQATLMLQMFQQQYPGRIPKAYTYRGLRPLTADEPFNIAGADIAADQAQLWTFTDHGPAHYAEIQFEEA
ncbi:hypothetical protein C9974_05595 [Marinobacter sp. B9-2]|jgi:itaconyl-CoA hydratase/mesaconyl-C4 CoA hydratase|nr:hypothetical protein C9974_05595 [Marinobacter sp. B9-2]